MIYSSLSRNKICGTM